MFEFRSAYKLNFVGLAFYLIETDLFLAIFCICVLLRVQSSKLRQLLKKKKKFCNSPKSFCLVWKTLYLFYSVG